jgi:hypothetical protein
MTMMNTHRPIAVSMVTGRVFKTGFGPLARLSSDISGTPNCFVKNHRPRDPQYWAKPCRTIGQRLVADKKKVSFPMG